MMMLTVYEDAIWMYNNNKTIAMWRSYGVMWGIDLPGINSINTYSGMGSPQYDFATLRCYLFVKQSY